MFLIMSRAAHYENPHVYDTSQHGNGFKQPWNTESFITVWSSYRNMTSSKGQCQILAGLFKKTNTVYLWDRNFRDELCLKPRRSEFVISRGNHNFVNNIYVLHWIFFFFDGVPLKVNSLLRSSSDTRADHTRDTIYWDEIQFLHRYEENQSNPNFLLESRDKTASALLPAWRCRSRRPVSVCVRLNTHNLVWTTVHHSKTRGTEDTRIL